MKVKNKPFEPMEKYAFILEHGAVANTQWTGVQYNK
jgi:hypothetical protein